jgi:hypothetical protein
VKAAALRAGLLADAEARERLFGGSVTLDDHLRLVAERADADFARAFAEEIGGDVKHARTTYGDREFVSAATDGRARLEQRTLVLAAGDGDDAIGLTDGRRLQIDFGYDGVVDFEVSRRRFDRIRVDGDGSDTLVLHGSASADDIHVAAGHFAGAERIDVDARGGDDSVTVDDLNPDGVFEVHAVLGAGADRLVADGNGEDEQSLILGSPDAVFVLGVTFVQVDDPERDDRLRYNGRGGDDLLGTSTDAMRMTLDGGDGLNSLFGGPGDDVLLGGDGFDDVSGGKGDDIVRMGPYFDRFSWAPGDGSDDVDGGGSTDSMFVTGSNEAERLRITRHLRDVRFTRDLDGAVVDLDGIEEIDAIALGGADVFHIGDLHGTGVREVNPSLAPSFGTADGDGAADRVEVEGGDDDATVTGQGRTVTVTGLAAKLGITRSDGLLDTLAIDTTGTVDSSGLPPGTIGLDVG